jgi:DNA-binding MarR family transcriptional regulator
MSDDDAAPRLDQQLCFAIYSTMHAINKTYGPLLERVGLTYPQYLVMLVLWETDDVTVKEIGEKLQLDSGTLTPLLKRIEAIGLIHRARDPKDERQVRVKLTDKGRELRAAAKGIPAEMARAMGRPAEDLKALRKDLRRVRNNLQGKRGKSDAKPPAG